MSDDHDDGGGGGLRERIIDLARIWLEESVEPPEDFADALIEALHLQRHSLKYWTLYNAAEQAHRMSLGPDNGVYSIEEARKRMAPYHPGGQGYEVVEVHSTWWSTPVVSTPSPKAQTTVAEPHP